MQEIKMKTKAFDCDYCVRFKPANQLFIRISNSSIAEVSAVFSDEEELAELSYSGRKYEGYKRLRSVKDEGTQLFLILE